VGDNHVTFSATVMAGIISKATAEADEDQFLGANFAQLQEVEDVYHDDEPDVVCYAHIIDNSVNEDPPASSRPIYRNSHRDFELILYHISQRVNNVVEVHIVHYDRDRPNLISREYNSPCVESVIDYADVMRLKLKIAGIHDSTDLMTVFEGRTDAEASSVFKTQLNDVDQKGLKTSTVRLLKEETLRHIAHANYISIRYDQMIGKTGADDEPENFPKMNVLVHHVVPAVAINQHRHKPNCWVNKVNQK
jgi:hypothetical protein